MRIAADRKSSWLLQSLWVIF